MRTIGILAIFVLSLCVIGQGAYLVKLSRQVDDLTERLSAPPAADEDGAVLRPRAVLPAARPLPGRADDGPRPTVPNFVLAAPAPSTPAATTLREALASSEGREQLKGALAMIKEEERQERLFRNAEREREREQRWRERITKGAALVADEPLKLDGLFTTLENARRQVLEDMKAGVKTAEQADDEIDALRENTERAVRALLGEERMKRLRDAEKKEREERKRAEQQQRQPQAVQQIQQQVQVAATR